MESKTRDDLQLIEDLKGENPVLQVAPRQNDMLLQRIGFLVQKREDKAARHCRFEERQRARESLNDQEDTEVGESSRGGQSESREGDMSKEDSVRSMGGKNWSIEEDPSTAASELEREDHRIEKEKRKKRKRSIKDEGIEAKVPHNLLELLSPVFTVHQISHNAATDIIAAVYRECSIDVDDNVTLSVASSKRLRSRENQFVSEKSFREAILRP